MYEQFETHQNIFTTSARVGVVLGKSLEVDELFSGLSERKTVTLSETREWKTFAPNSRKTFAQIILNVFDQTLQNHPELLVPMVSVNW